MKESLGYSSVCVCVCVLLFFTHGCNGHSLQTLAKVTALSVLLFFSYLRIS